jgi:hypothetical protein
MLRSALALLLLAVTVASAEVPDDWKKIRSLLKDFDYEVEKQDERLVANHDDHLTLVIVSLGKGVLIRSWFITSDMDVSERDLRKLNNKLNLKATAARYYVDDDGDLMCEAWLAGKWDEDTFEVFLEAWQGDTDKVSAMLNAIVD